MSGGAPASNQPAPKPSAPTASAGKPSGLDRWKLKPVGPGYLRGQIRNIRRSEDISRFGTLRVVEFDLDRGGGLPPVPVEMRGLYFNRDVPEGRVCDVADPTPHIRPLVTGLITFPLLVVVAAGSADPGGGDRAAGVAAGAAPARLNAGWPSGGLHPVPHPHQQRPGHAAQMAMPGGHVQQQRDAGGEGTASGHIWDDITYFDNAS